MPLALKMFNIIYTLGGQLLLLGLLVQGLMEKEKGTVLLALETTFKISKKEWKLALDMLFSGDSASRYAHASEQNERKREKGFKVTRLPWYESRR